MNKFTRIIRPAPPRKQKVIDDLEAMKLVEDIQTLELINELLCKLDKQTLSDDANEAATSLRRMSFIVMACRNRARDKLRHFWLAGEVVPARQKPQTLADIWELLKASLEKIKGEPPQK